MRGGGRCGRALSEANLGNVSIVKHGESSLYALVRFDTAVCQVLRMEYALEGDSTSSQSVSGESTTRRTGPSGAIQTNQRSVTHDSQMCTYRHLRLYILRAKDPHDQHPPPLLPTRTPALSRSNQ
jgi:hypothetical protein